MLDSLSFLAAADANILDKLNDTLLRVTTTFHVDWPSFLAQVLNFGIAAFVIYHFALRPILSTVDERNKRIAEGLQYAEDMKRKLAEARKQHEEILRKASHDAQQIIAEARESAKALVEKATQDAARQAEDILRKGNEAVALEHQKMLADLRREVAGLVVATTGRVLGRDLTSDERARFAATAAQDLSKN